MAFDDTEPKWCEDCGHFVDVGPDGEGHCDAIGEDTWYGQIACEDNFKTKGEDD